MKKYVTEDVIHELVVNPESQAKFEEEFARLHDDRTILREIFKDGNTRVVLPCNLNRMIWNARKTFKINSKNNSDLNPLRVIEG